VLLLASLITTGCAGSMRLPPRTDGPGIESLTSRRLAADPRLCRYQITVAVYGRSARLEGKVSSDADRRRADHLAREAGAARIDDQLIIDPAAGDGGRC
jgi:osmotically-inducible protein OsmY